DPTLGEEALIAITHIGRRPDVAAPYLHSVLDNSDHWKVLARAAYAVGTYGPAIPEVLPRLIRLLGHAPEGVVPAAAWAIGRLGAEGAVAIPHLGKVLAAHENEAGVNAVEALVTLAPFDPKAAVPAFQEGLTSLIPEVSLIAWKALRQLAP